MPSEYQHDHPNFDCSFEVSPFVCRLTGGMRATIFEEGQKGPQEQISVANNWGVDVEWYLKGHLVRHLCGEFCIGLHLESIGEGKEYSFHQTVKMDPCGGGYYRHRFGVPAGTIDAADCGKLYVVAVTLTSKDECGGDGHITAYCKEGCVMFINPPA